MFDEIRNHDSNPTPVEREWMALDVVDVVTKSVVLAAFALMIGISASVVLG